MQPSAARYSVDRSERPALDGPLLVLLLLFGVLGGGLYRLPESLERCGCSGVVAVAGGTFACWIVTRFRGGGRGRPLRVGARQLSTVLFLLLFFPTSESVQTG